MKALFSLLIISLTITGALAQAPLTATEIVKKAEDKLRGTTTAQSSMTITTVRPNWQREMTLKSWSKGEDYSLMLITSPAKDKGISFLKRNKEIWNWVPSIERTVKLPPSMMSQSWMGTDLTNDDMVRESSNVTDYTHKILGEEMIDGHMTYKIELTPKENAAVVWDKIIVFIDKKNFVQRRSEMYDEDGTLVNVLKSSDVKMMGGKEIATKTEFIPMDKEGHKTIMVINSIEFDKPIEDSFFTIQNMKNVK